MPFTQVRSTSNAAIAVHTLNDAPEGAPVLLVCHALGFCAPAYAPLARALAPHLRCFGIDLRWHGRSTPPDDGSFEWEKFAEDVRAVLASPVLPRGVPVHGFGHSLGGAALTLAASTDSDAFRSLYFFEPIVVPPELRGPRDSRNRMAEVAERRRSRFVSRAQAERNFETKSPFAAFDAEARAGYLDGGFDVLDDGALELRCRPEWEAAMFRAVSDNRSWEAAPNVRTPVRLAVGGEAVGPSVFAAPLAKRLGVEPPVRFESLAHLGPMEAPEAVADSVLAWTRSHA